MEGESIRKPALVAHADWSKDSKKRWYATAVLEADGHYLVSVPRMVGCLASYFRRLRGNLGADAAALAGFDFPIGLPVRRATRPHDTDRRLDTRLLRRLRTCADGRCVAAHVVGGAGRCVNAPSYPRCL